MGVRGAKLKPEGTSRTRHAPTHEWAEFANAPYTGAPALPRRTGGAWPAATLRWWKAVSSMPHCGVWTDTDWQFAVDTAEVHARFASGLTTAAAELRQRESRMGTTMDARRDLRIRYVEPKPVPSAAGEVVQLDSYRDLYG